jgi:hypothetical protein
VPDRTPIGLGTYTAGSDTDSFVFIAHNPPNQTLGNFKSFAAPSHGRR